MKKRLISAMVIGANLLAVMPAMAITPEVGVKAEARVQARTDASKVRCDARKARVEARLQEWSSLHTRHVGVFANAAVRIQKVIDLAKAQGVATAELEADLVALKAAQAKLEASRKAAGDKMNNMLSASCAASLEAWKADITAFQALVVQVKTDAKAVKDLYLNTIKPDLMSVAAEVKAKIRAEAAAEDEDGENE